MLALKIALLVLCCIATQAMAAEEPFLTVHAFPV
jgi:hypothetical protein